MPFGDYEADDARSLCRVVAELRARFAEYMKTGEDAKIPADLQRIIYSMVRLMCYIKRGGDSICLVRPYDTAVARNTMP